MDIKQEISSFFNTIKDDDKDMDLFIDKLLFISVNEWHINPEEVLELPIPMILTILKERNKYIEESSKYKL